MVKSILVLGGGSAGFLAALTLKVKLPQLDVTVLRSPDIGIIGVGEGTTTYVPEHLHGYLGIPLDQFFASAKPSWKLGVRFLWGPGKAFHYPFTYVVDRREAGLSRPVGYYAGEDFTFADPTSALMSQGLAFFRQANGAPHIERNIAYHLENEHLVAYLETVVRQSGVRVVDGTVERVEQAEQGITGLTLASGQTMTADLYVDCSGFRSELLGKAFAEPFESYRSTLFCDRAIVGGWARENEPILPYTTAETMQAGWCWQIEHEHRINRGYVYSSDFISDDDAETEYRALCPKVRQTRIVKFNTGAYARSWVKNVVAIGNSAGFVEPLEATALYGICAMSQALAASLIDAECRPEQLLATQFNAYSKRIWSAVRNFLAVHYRFNRRIDSPFWRACQADVELVGAQPIVEYYQEYGPSSFWAHTLIDPIDPFRLDGYFTLLMGQQVPYRRTYQPTDSEQQRWRQLQQEWASAASGGMSIAEALQITRSPYWQWTAGFYQ